MKIWQKSYFCMLGLIYWSFIVIVSLSSISCKKYLDKKRDTSLVTPTTLEDLQGLLDDATGVMNQQLTPSFGEASADDYILPASVYMNNISVRLQHVYVWQPYDYYFNEGANDWIKAYNAIYNSNYCLEMIEKIPVTIQNKEKWQNVKGSGLFYRAYNFLNLIWNHGKAFDEMSSESDLGIVLRLGSDFNVPSVRSNVKRCYEQVIADAMQSIALLPQLPLHPFRPSRSAAFGLLARTYLTMRRYDSALKYSDLCLQVKNSLVNYNGDADLNSSNITTSSTPFKKFNKETIFYTEMNSLPIINSGRARVDFGLYSSYSDSDWRKGAFFRLTSGYYSFKGNYTQANSYFTGIAVDEMYLTRAECYSRVGNGGIGNKELALQDLNKLLANRWKTGFFFPVSANTAAEALEKILIERRKELAFRGLRWIDIKRLNKEGRNIILTRVINSQNYTLKANANYYALPLPTDIINLTGMPQNPQ